MIDDKIKYKHTYIYQIIVLNIALMRGVLHDI